MLRLPKNNRIVTCAGRQLLNLEACLSGGLGQVLAEFFVNGERLALDHAVKFKFNAAFFSDLTGFFFKQSMEAVECLLRQRTNVGTEGNFAGTIAIAEVGAV